VPHLSAGVGFGGGCLPKDIRAFSARADELGRAESVAFLKEVDAINLRRRQRVVDLVVTALNDEPYQKKVAVLGLRSSPTPTTCATHRLWTSPSSCGDAERRSWRPTRRPSRTRAD